MQKAEILKRTKELKKVESQFLIECVEQSIPESRIIWRSKTPGNLECHLTPKSGTSEYIYFLEMYGGGGYNWYVQIWRHYPNGKYVDLKDSDRMGCYFGDCIWLASEIVRNVRYGHQLRGEEEL